MAKRAWRYWEPTFQADEVCELNPVWPWGGHRRFAYDLTRWMRPARIAELGVHWGTSFFTFAQAIKDGRMKDTELIGVDTFEGEEHAGEYGPEVLDTVRKVIAQHFAKQTITVHQMYFRDALDKVEDESIELLHIDGLHTFEAVKDDFETWLPKLAPEGVVLFHDVAPDTGYGSTEYWNQLSEEHPGFAFEHSWGLGVLFPKGRSRLDALEADGLTDKLAAYPAIARALRADHEIADLRRMAKDRQETVQKQSERIAEVREQLAQLRESTVPAAAAERLTKRAEAAERLAKERGETVTKQSAALKQAEQRLESAREQAKAAKEQVKERSAALKQAEQRITKLEPRLAAAEALRDELREARQISQQRNDDLREQNTALREQAAAREAELKRIRQEDQAARKAIEKQLAAMAEHLSAMVQSQKQRDKANETKLAELAQAVEQARRAGEAAAATLAKRLGRLDTDAELLTMRAEHLEDVVSRHRAQLDAGPAAPAGEPDWLTGEQTAPKPGQGRRSPRKS